MARRNCEQCSAWDDISKLDEIRTTLWAISVVTRRTTKDIDELLELKASQLAEAQRCSMRDWC